MGKKVITCSELERFAYCPYSWWLSREGVKGEGEAIRQGVENHHRLEEGLEMIKEMDDAAGVAEKGLVGFNIGTIVLAVLGLLIILVKLFGDEESASLGTIVIILGLIWLLMACFWLYDYLSSTNVSMTLRASHGVPSGKIEYSDKIRAPSYFSENYMLSGKPDYVLRKGDDHIPVEIKTGRVPRGPLFSHILQVVAYCLLMEDEHGSQPPYGIVEYADQIQHKIDYDEKGKDLVLSKLDEMREILDGYKNPYRNHNRKGKCRNCSRKEACPLRLDLSRESRRRSGDRAGYQKRRDRAEQGRSRTGDGKIETDSKNKEDRESKSKEERDSKSKDDRDSGTSEDSDMKDAVSGKGTDDQNRSAKGDRDVDGLKVSVSEEKSVSDGKDVKEEVSEKERENDLPDVNIGDGPDKK